MPILFRSALRPQCPVRRRNIVVCWARFGRQIGSRCAWYTPCLVSAVFVLPVSIIPRVEKCLGLSVGDRVMCLRCLIADFCKSVCSFISCQSHISSHPLEGYLMLSCLFSKGGMQALDHPVWISCRVDRELVKMAIFLICFPLSNRCSAAVQMASFSAQQLEQ